MLRVLEIHQPATVEEASQMLAEQGDEATIYAGGTELLLMMKEGLIHYPHLIDIKKIPGLSGIRLNKNGGNLEIGALVTHRQIERDSIVREYAPLLVQVENQVANLRIRTAGTIGGNLCFAEPHSDPATLLVAWGAILELASASRRREIPVEQFLTGSFETLRQADEILTGIRLPLLSPEVGGAYERFSVHERPVASVAVLLRIQSGVVLHARIAVGGVNPYPLRIDAAEELLSDHHADDSALNAAAEYAAREVDPVGDLYGSEDYKRHLVQVLTFRALRQAVSQAKGNGHVN